MFEYIKKVSLAISFIANKVDSKQAKLIGLLQDQSFELLALAQIFRSSDGKVEDLKQVYAAVAYLVDLVDFAKLSQHVSVMNAQVFIDSQLAFLKHILHLINQKNNELSPLVNLKEMDDSLARKIAKESAVVAAINSTKANLDFAEVPAASPDTFMASNITYANLSAKSPFQNVVVPASPKKILESTFLAAEEEGAETDVETTEKEIYERRQNVLKALVNGGGAIREIVAKVKGVNSKTLQRDLLELMRDKKVIMLGKKRWAKYYLK